MLDFNKAMRTDTQLLESIMVPHLIDTALSNVHKDGGGEHVHGPWLEIVKQAARAEFRGIDQITARRLALRIERDTSDCLRLCGCENYKSLVLAVSLLIIDLVKDGLYLDAKNQGVLIASKVVAEALDYGDWGDLKSCKVSAGRLRNHLNFLGYYNDKNVILH